MGWRLRLDHLFHKCGLGWGEDWGFHVGEEAFAEAGKGSEVHMTTNIILLNWIFGIVIALQCNSNLLFMI